MTHDIAMRWSADLTGAYGWQGLCDCGYFMAQAPTFNQCRNLCEEHLAEMMLA